MKKNKSAEEIILNSSTIENLSNNNKNDNNVLFATQIYCLRKNNTDEKVEELISCVEKYKKDIQDKIKHGKVTPNYKFRKIFCKNIELNLIQIGEIKSKEKRDEYINKLYQWYKNKLLFYSTLSHMNKRTYVKKDEYYDYTKYNLKNNKQDNTIDENDSENELKHRTKITYKKVHYYIEEFRKHQINYKKYKNKGNKSVEMRPMFKNNKIKNFTYKNNNLNKFYTKKIDKKISEPGIFDTSIPKYETKSSYSIERPDFNSIILKIEKKINISKNKHIMEKRNQEEIKKYVNDFGKNRAMFKSDLNKNLEIKNIIKEFKTFQKYEKNKFLKSKNNSMIEEKNENNISQNENRDNNIDKENNTSNQNNIRKISKININNIKNMNNNSLLITSLYTIGKKKEENENTIRNKLLLTNKEDNVQTNNDNESKEGENKKEKTINIYCEFPKLKSNRLLSFKKYEDDAVIKNMAIDPIYRTKRYISKLCSLDNNLKKVECKESNYSLSNTKYMSCSNILNNHEKYEINNIHNYNKNHLSVSNDNNYLKIKNSFNFFKKEKYSKLRAYINEKEHTDTLNKTALYRAFIDPKFDIIYPNYYLPKNNGYNLLSRQKPIYEKRKK